jgi:hypothetical protein
VSIFAQCSTLAVSLLFSAEIWLLAEKAADILANRKKQPLGINNKE